MAVESQGKMPNAPLKAFYRKHSQKKYAHSVAASKKTKCGSTNICGLLTSLEKHQPWPRFPNTFASADSAKIAHT